MSTANIEREEVIAERVIADAAIWGQSKRPNIEFGRLCYEYGQKHGAQGSRSGRGLAPILKKLNIKEGTAYYWIAKYRVASLKSIVPTGVYFIQDTGTGHIKIGWSKGVEDRLRTLQQANPSELLLLRSVNGGRKEEAGFHRKFQRLRVRGEWFRPTPELLDFIKGIR